MTIEAEIPKFKNLRQQLEVQTIPGILVTINCPWCESQNVEGHPFCCDSLRRAIQLIMSETPKLNHA